MFTQRNPDNFSMKTTAANAIQYIYEEECSKPIKSFLVT